MSETYTPNQLAKIYGCSRNSIRYSINKGRLYARWCPHSYGWLIPKEEAIAYLHRHGLTFPIRKDLLTTEQVAKRFNRSIEWANTQGRTGKIKSCVFLNKRLYCPDSVEEFANTYTPYEPPYIPSPEEVAREASKLREQRMGMPKRLASEVSSPEKGAGGGSSVRR